MQNILIDKWLVKTQQLLQNLFQLSIIIIMNNNDVYPRSKATLFAADRFLSTDKFEIK